MRKERAATDPFVAEAVAGDQDGFRLVADVPGVTMEHPHVNIGPTETHPHQPTDPGEEEEPTDDSEKAPPEAEALLWRALALESAAGRPVVVRPRRRAGTGRGAPRREQNDGTTEI